MKFKKKTIKKIKEIEMLFNKIQNKYTEIESEEIDNINKLFKNRDSLNYFIRFGVLGIRELKNEFK